MDWKELLFNELKDLRKESQEHAGEVDTRLTAIERDLKYHIKRTDLLESEIKPVKKHVDGLQYIGKMTFWVITSLGIMAGAITKIKGLW